MESERENRTERAGAEDCDRPNVLYLLYGNGGGGGGGGGGGTGGAKDRGSFLKFSNPIGL